MLSSSFSNARKISSTVMPVRHHIYHLDFIFIYAFFLFANFVGFSQSYAAIVRGSLLDIPYGRFMVV